MRLLAVAIVAAALPAAPAQAAFPGLNGRIAFTSARDGNDEIYSMNPDGTGQVNLTKNTGNDAVPAWSPDGSKIAFRSQRDGDSEIYVMNADGSNQMRLTNHPNVDSEPAWSADGSKIVFSSWRDEDSGFDSELYVMDADGSNLVQLTDDPAWDSSPRWSPDGSKIVFARDPDGPPSSDVYVMNADGTNAVRLTDFDSPLGASDPAWSPDGSKIAFAGWVSDVGRSGDDEIYVMNADGSNQVRLTDNPNWDFRPVWSPDGSNIAWGSGLFTGDLNTTDFNIWTMKADGTNPVQLTDSPDIDWEPDWQSLTDTAPPVITVPDHITVPATTPAGAVVTYTVSAVDEVDGPVAVSCSPPSGSQFSIGTTTVTCTASDQAGNSAVAAFEVTVLSAQQQIGDAIETVEDASLPQGTNESLSGKLSAAEQALAEGKTTPACNMLKAAIHQIEAQSGKDIDPDLADELVDDINRIRSAIGCDG